MASNPSAQFTYMLNAVYNSTLRQDLVTTTQQAVIAATSKSHGLDFFKKDIQTADVRFDQAPGGQGAYIQTLDTSALPRYRALNYIRKWDPSYNPSQLSPAIMPPLQTGLTGIYGSRSALGLLEIIAPDDLFDDYMSERVDVAYEAGSTIMIKSSTPLAMVKIGWYQWPFMDLGNNYAGYSSWIANEYPFAIIYEAMASVFADIGMVDTAKSIVRPPDPRIPGDRGGQLHGQVQALLMSNIGLKGY